LADQASYGGQSGSSLNIRELDQWQEGGRVNTDHHWSPIGEWVLSNGHAGK